MALGGIGMYGDGGYTAAGTEEVRPARRGEWRGGAGCLVGLREVWLYTIKSDREYCSIPMLVNFPISPVKSV